MDEQINRWKTRLSNQTTLTLPTDFPSSSRIVESEFSLGVSAASSIAILKLSLSTSASPFSILLAAFVVLLHRYLNVSHQRYTSEEDISIGSSSSSTNPLVLRMNLTAAMSFNEVIRLNINERF